MAVASSSLNPVKHPQKRNILQTTDLVFAPVKPANFKINRMASFQIRRNNFSLVLAVLLTILLQVTSSGNTLEKDLTLTYPQKVALDKVIEEIGSYKLNNKCVHI